MSQMRRRSFRQLKARSEANFHHCVYAVLLAPEAAKDRRVRQANPNRDPAKPCIYIGMTGLTPEERFRNHKAGIKAAAVVRKYGVKLLPELYGVYNPMPYEGAAQMEKELAAELRAQGYTVMGGT
jgi:hypothetical protein